MLELEDVSTHYGLVSVLRNVTIRIFPGEIVCLLGGNASGKTTTLKTILGIVHPSTGQVRLDGEDVNGPPDQGSRGPGDLDGPGEPAAVRANDRP